MQAKELVLLMSTMGLPATAALAADHADTPALVSLGRHDARITDLHAFTVGDDLVISVSTNPNIPVGQATYTFPADLSVVVHIDNDARVAFGDPATAQYGGTILNPSRVDSDVTLTVTFPGGVATLAADGLRGQHRCRHEDPAGDIQLFAGLRDDPFIRGPRQGRNVAAVVIQVPLAAVKRSSRDTLLLWATTDVPTMNGPQVEHAGRALRSQNLIDDQLNVTTPALHYTLLGLAPDVMIYDTSRPAHFPNGRALQDDVLDLLPDTALLANDAPFPSANDRPLLAAFPYLAEPW